MPGPILFTQLPEETLFGSIDFACYADDTQLYSSIIYLVQQGSVAQASQTRTWERPSFSRCQKTWPRLTQACYWESRRCGASILPPRAVATEAEWRYFNSCEEEPKTNSFIRSWLGQERALSSQVSKMTDGGYRVKAVAQGQQCERVVSQLLSWADLNLPQAIRSVVIRATHDTLPSSYSVGQACNLGGTIHSSL